MGRRWMRSDAYLNEEMHGKERGKGRCDIAACLLVVVQDMAMWEQEDPINFGPILSRPVFKSEDFKSYAAAVRTASCKSAQASKLNASYARNGLVMLSGQINSLESSVQESIAMTKEIRLLVDEVSEQRL